MYIFVKMVKKRLVQSGISRCAAKDCKNNARNSLVSFFRFPKDIERAQTWAIACEREDLLSKLGNLHTSYRLCGVHFENSMFLNDLRNRLQSVAVPTKFSTQRIPNTTEDVSLESEKTDAEGSNSMLDILIKEEKDDVFEEDLPEYLEVNQDYLSENKDYDLSADEADSHAHIHMFFQSLLGVAQTLNAKEQEILMYRLKQIVSKKT